MAGENEKGKEREMATVTSGYARRLSNMFLI
jgi:hypothetical protein